MLTSCVCWNGYMRKNLWLLSTLLAGALALTAGQTDTSKSAGQDLKDAGKNTTHAVTKGAKKTGHLAKKGANKTAGAVENGAGKLKGKTATTSTQ